MNKREWMLQAALMWVRAGHGGAADEVAATLSGTYDAICAASPETPEEGAWVEHDGDVSKAPEAGRMVEVMFRDGSSHIDDTEELSWDHLEMPLDVVRWRHV